MYLELVKQVSQVEQETEASVRQAAQQAQQMQEEAERSGRALVEQTRRRKPHSDEVGRMMLNGFHALAHYVLPVLFTQMELCAESRLL